MPNKQYYYGEDRIISILVGTNYVPVGCLTNNGFDESTDFIETTTVENGGWKSEKPIKQSYSISFEGLQVLTSVGSQLNLLISYDKLKILKRTKTLIYWKISAIDGSLVDTGRGYISALSESAQDGEWLTFSCAINGFGAPEFVSAISDGTSTGGGINEASGLYYYGPANSIPNTEAQVKQWLTGGSDLDTVTLNTGTGKLFIIVAPQSFNFTVYDPQSDEDLSPNKGYIFIKTITVNATVCRLYALQNVINYTENHTHIITWL